MYTVYIILLFGLLILQWKMMQGEMIHFVANLLAFVLACPTIVLMKKTWMNEDKVTKQVGQVIPEKSMVEEKKVVETKAENKTLKEIMEDFMVCAKSLGFSEREREVAWLIYRGYTNLQIAEELYIAETTVKKHASHIYEKAGASGRKELKQSINDRLKNKD